MVLRTVELQVIAGVSRLAAVLCEWTVKGGRNVHGGDDRLGLCRGTRDAPLDLGHWFHDSFRKTEWATIPCLLASKGIVDHAVI